MTSLSKDGWDRLMGSEPGTELVLPDGQLVSLDDPAACAVALTDLRLIEQRIKELKAMLTDTVAEESRRQGRKTMVLAGGIQVVVTGGSRTLWDAQQLEADLRVAGMGEERIREIVMEEVSYAVNATEAKRAASANEDYAAAVEGARTVVEQRPTIRVERP